MPQTTPLKALIALAILTSGALLAPPAAQARRFGGGHSSGMSRSISTHSAPPSHISHDSPSSARSTEPTDRPPYPIEHATLPPSRASVQDNFHWPDAASAVLARARIEAARSRQASRHRYNAFAPTPAPAATAMPFEADRATRNESALAENSSRPADPRFARLTESQPAPSTSCEFKAVMSDADYIACGATPPQFPLAR